MIGNILSKIIAHRAGIMLGGAAVGVVVTSVLAAKDARKYDDEIAIKGEDILENMTDEEYDEYMDCQDENTWRHAHVVKTFATKKEQAIIFAKSYWRTGLSMAVTFGLMILSHRSMVKELAATAAALGVMSTKYQELASTLKEKYPEQYNKVMKIIEQKNAGRDISKKGLKKEESYDGRNRYYEEFSGQTFFATEAQIKEAECAINERIINTGESNLFTYLATFPKSSGVKLEDWMKHVGWYEGNDTAYTYASGNLGPYVKPEVVNEPIILNGKKINVNKIRWHHVPDFDPELDRNEIGCIEATLEGIA